MFCFVTISHKGVIGWEGWVFCTSQEISWEDILQNDSFCVKQGIKA